MDEHKEDKAEDEVIVYESNRPDGDISFQWGSVICDYMKKQIGKDYFTIKDLEQIDNFNLDSVTNIIDTYKNLTDIVRLLNLNKKVKFTGCVKISTNDDYTMEEINRLVLNRKDSLEGATFEFTYWDEFHPQHIMNFKEMHLNIQLNLMSIRGLNQETLDELKNANIDIKVYGYKNLGEVEDTLKAFEEIRRVIPEGSGEIETFMAIHQILAKTIKYDTSGTVKGNEVDGKFTRSTAGAVLYGRAVCSGYARALKDTLHYFGIESKTIGGLGHAWNQVKIQGKWYNVDLTYNATHMREGEFPVWMLLSDETFYNKLEHDALEHEGRAEACTQDYPISEWMKILINQESIIDKFIKVEGKGISRIGREQYECNALKNRAERSRTLAKVRATIIRIRNKGNNVINKVEEMLDK